MRLAIEYQRPIHDSDVRGSDADTPPELRPAMYCKADFVPLKALLGSDVAESIHGRTDGSCALRLWSLLDSISAVLEAPGFGGQGPPSAEDQRERWPHHQASMEPCILPYKAGRQWKATRKTGMSLLADNDRNHTMGRLKLKLGYRKVTGPTPGQRKKIVNMWAQRFVCWAQHGGAKALMMSSGEDDVAWPMLQVLHRCREGRCLHPLHMSWGTAQQNRAERGR